MLKMFLLCFILVVLLAGCATLGETIGQIGADPASYIAEAEASAAATKQAIPELPLLISLGLGYLAAFLRGWYKNVKREQAKATGRVA